MERSGCVLRNESRVPEELAQWYRRGNGADSRMKFAYDLVAVALIKQRDAANQTIEEFLKEEFTFLVEVTRQVIPAVSVISIRDVWIGRVSPEADPSRVRFDARLSDPQLVSALLPAD